jgi:hypothetical protein
LSQYGRESVIDITQHEEPFNEFLQNDILLYKAFPHLFPLGKGLRTHGSLAPKDVRHLLMQFHGKFAACFRLIFLLFDQLQRHSAARVIAAKVKTDPESLTKFQEMVTDRTFLKRLQSAKENPNSDEAKLLARSINKHVTMANSNVPYTAAQRKSSVSHLYNMARFYGTPSIFFTFAPDDINGCLNLRMALPLSDNLTFPAVDGGFCVAIRNNSDQFQNLSVSQAGLRAILASGPVAAAEMFRLIVDNVFCNIMGTPPANSHHKKTIPLPKRHSGAFGVPVAAYGCTEEQARGSLHMHIVFWGGLQPSVLQAAGGIHLLADVVSKAIDLIVCAELDPVTHLRHIIRDLQGETLPHACLFPPHHP